MVNVNKLINQNKWDKIYSLIKNNKINIDDDVINSNKIAHLAAINNKDKIIKYLLKHYPNKLKKSNNDGNTAIHLLAIYGYIDLLEYCIDHNNEFIELLNNNNESVLHLLYNNYPFIKWVCENIKNITFNNDNNGQNIILKNIKETSNKKDNSYKIIKILINKFKKQLFETEESLLSFCVKYNINHIANLLIDNGYDTNKRDRKFMTPFIYAVKNKNKQLTNKLIKISDINYCGPEGDYNPMMFAIILDDHDLINNLLEYNFNVNNFNRYMETSVHYALYNKEKPLPPSIISEFLYKGDLNVKNINGDTPLHLLCKNHDWTVYSKILKIKPIDIFIEDKEQKKPLDYINGNHIYNFLDIVVDSYLKIVDNKKSNVKECVIDKGSINCKNELKKYIFKTKRSIPLIEDGLNVSKEISKLTTNNTPYVIFNSDSLHNLIYITNILKKYPNLGLPTQEYIKDKYINDKLILDNNNLYNNNDSILSDLVNIYFNYSYEMLPYLILWKDKWCNYYHKDLKFLIKKNLISQNIRFIVLKLTLITSHNSTHANIVIYDKKNNTLERFEPYGIIPYLDPDNLDLFIEDIGKKCINENLVYYKPNNLFDTIGFQTISNDNNLDIKNLGDPPGFCLAWTLWYLELRLSNPNSNPKFIIKNSLQNILDNKDVSKEKLFISFIRNYAFQLDTQKNEFMKLCGIHKNSIYNINPSKSDVNKITTMINFELEKILIQRF